MNELALLDRVRTIVITAMFSDPDLRRGLAVKGGAALDLIYDELHRSSLDIDFSLRDGFTNLAAFSDCVTRVLTGAFHANGMRLIDFEVKEQPDLLSDDMRDFWGGYCITFKLVKVEDYDAECSLETRRRRAIRLHSNNSTAFSIDVSKFEVIDGRVEVELDGKSVYAYTPLMLASEKLRALCQQLPEYGKVIKRKRNGSPRGRDCLDIFALCTKLGVRFDDPDFAVSVKDMFAIKRVPLSLIPKINDYREFHRPDFDKLRDTAREGHDLESFDFYFDFVVGQIRLLEHLWIEDLPA